MRYCALYCMYRLQKPHYVCMYVCMYVCIRGVGTLTQVRGLGSRCSMLYINTLDTGMILGPTPQRRGGQGPLVPISMHMCINKYTRLVGNDLLVEYAGNCSAMHEIVCKFHRRPN